MSTMDALSTEAEEEDGTFVKTEDLITVMNTDHSDPQYRGFLAGEGFGSSSCHLEPHPTDNNVANDLWKCTFQLEQSMSVHALYGRGREQVEATTGRRIVLYGHAVLLRHVPTDKRLCCQTSTSLSSHKLAYDVGFMEKSKPITNACWFRVKPATKQRSEGEKVRTGDDVFLINVATERYLSAHQNGQVYKSVVQASFQQSLWALHIMCCGSAKQDAIGYVNGGDVVRMIHRHSGMDCLTVAARASDSVCSQPCCDDEVVVCYESEAVQSQVRSLWRVELTKMRFGGQFTEWGQPFRLRHVVTGDYLGIAKEDDNKLTLLPPSKAELKLTRFRFRQSLVSLQWREGKVESMGSPQVKFGDSLVLLQHFHTGRWLGMPAADQLHRGKVGQKTSKQALLHNEGHLNFALTVTRGFEQQIQAAIIMEVTDETMRSFINRGLPMYSSENATDYDSTEVLQMINILKELLKYFEPAQRKQLPYHEKKKQLTMLKEKQNLFHNQGRLKFVASVIQKLSLVGSSSGDGNLIEVKHLLFQLLSAMIKGNKVNCSQFVAKSWTDMFIKELTNPTFTHDILEILLHQSAEVVEYLHEEHVKAIANLLNTFGREGKVMQLLSSLCVCHGAAVREKQRLCYHLMAEVKDLLLFPVMHNRVYCYRYNLELVADMDNALAHCWYYEVTVTQVTSPDDHHLRAGWIDLEHYRPDLGTFSEQLGTGYSSVGFDGSVVWTGGHSVSDCAMTYDEESLQLNSGVMKNDVFGCCLDTVKGLMTFTLNGIKVGTEVHMGQSSGRFTAAVSFSAGVQISVAFGGNHGLLKYPIPAGYSPLTDALVTKLDRIWFQPCVSVGDPVKMLLHGPQKLAVHTGFCPMPIDTSEVSLPSWVEDIEHRLAAHIHDVWAVSKIDSGWTYNEVRNNEKKWHPMLRPYSALTTEEQQYDHQISEETLKTLIALGYCVMRHEALQSPSIVYQHLDRDKYEQSNGYLPRPLDLSAVTVPEDLMELIHMLAENNHKVWAKEKIKDGWKFGSATDNDSKRNPALVPYASLDEETRDLNWNSAHDVVRSVILLGCSLEPTSSSNSQTVSDLSLQESVVVSETRTFRGQYSHVLTKGKWYYEVKIHTPGMIRVGWTRPHLPAGVAVGSDHNSYAFDGYAACKWHVTSERFGKRWKVGNVVGCYLDLEELTMMFAVNGKMLYTGNEEAAFRGFEIGAGFVPAITTAVGQNVAVHFGKPVVGWDTLTYYNNCSGYFPVCKNMCDNIPLWYSTTCGRYEPIVESHHPTLSVVCDNDNITILNTSAEGQHHHTTSDELCLRLTMGLHFDPSQNHSTPNSPIHSSQRTSFSVIVPAGQDATLIYIGWTTQDFKYLPTLFKKSPTTGKAPGCQTIRLVDTRSSSSEEYVTGYMTCLVDLFKRSRLVRMDSTNDNISSDFTIGCILDLLTGKISYTLNKEDVTHCDIKVTHRGKLYPTIVTTPTTQTVATFKLTPEEGCVALSHLVLKSLCRTQTIPILPHRVKVLTYSKSYWNRVDYYISHASVDQRLGSYFGDLVLETTKEEKVISCTTTELGMIFNISELFEHDQVRKFYLNTLVLFCSICSHGNENEAADIKKRLNKDLLLKCLQIEGMPYSVKKAYYDLFSHLFLHRQVTTRLLTRGERIIQMPPFKESTPTPVNTPATENVKSSLSMLVASSLSAIKPKKVFTLNHSISGKLTITSPNFQDDSPADVITLKHIVFSSLRRILIRGDLKCSVLSEEDKANLVVPLLNMMDSLLIIGQLEEESDITQLLNVLKGDDDDDEFTGLLALPLNEPIKLAVCDLLQHLCDCQLQHRVEGIVKFAHDYTYKLRKNQEGRYKKEDKLLLPKEFRTATDKQVQRMLNFTDVDNPGDCPISKELRHTLVQFHRSLRVHCGISHSVIDTGSKQLEEMDTTRQWRRLWNLMFNVCSNGEDEPDSAGSVTELQRFIIKTMVNWSREEILDPHLISKIFALLYRQYNEVNEVAKALSNTYVLEENPASSSGCSNVMAFREALAAVRIRLEVGIGFEEEDLLNSALKSLSHNKLFKDHPELVRSLGVHTLVLQLLDVYLGIDQTASHDRHNARKLKSLARHRTVNSVVINCCKFLCKFASVNSDNQRALFPHIGGLLKHSEDHPDMAVSTDYSLVRVATSTISNNEELVFELTESHFEHVVSLLIAVSTSQSETDDVDAQDNSIHLGAMKIDGNEVKWSPKGAERLLDFLNASVCVAGKSIQENALIIIRLLIQRPECLGPALAGDVSLGLGCVYTAVTSDKDLHEPNMNWSFSDSISMNMSSLYLSDGGGTDIVLPFYNSLVRLLAWCSPDIERLQSGSNTNTNELERSVQENTHHILCSLIRKEDISVILALPFDESEILSPHHKEVVLQFLDKVYGWTEAEFLTELLSSSFIPDIKLALDLHQNSDPRPGLYSSLCYYLCMFVMPYLTKYSKCLQNWLLVHQFNVVQKWMVYSYELSCQPKLPHNFLSKIAKFLSTVCVVLPPNIIHLLMPRFIVSIPDLRSNCVVAIQYMTAHYSHFNRYYSLSGGWGAYGSASEDEKKLTLIMLYRLVEALCKAVTNKTIDSGLLKCAIDCMQVLVDAVPPEGLFPPVNLLQQEYESRWGNYHPSPSDVRNTKLDVNMTALAGLVARHNHDTWVYTEMEDGWLYGDTFDDSDKKNPKMVDFGDLIKDDKDQYLEPALRVVKVLSEFGWKIMKQKSHSIKLERKAPLVCYLPKSKRFVPSPLNLTKIHLDSKAYALAEKLASEAHDNVTANAAKLNSTDSFSSCIPYDLLRESDKEVKRQYFVNFMKIMKAHNFEVSKARTTTTSSSESKYKTMQTFGVELITFVMECLDIIEGKMNLLVSVYAPLIHSYLCHYHDYFLPDQSNRSTHDHSEDVLVIELFCKMFAVCQKYLVEIVPRENLDKDCTTTRNNVKVIVDCLAKVCAVINPKAMSSRSKVQDVKCFECLSSFLENAGQSLDELFQNVNHLSPVQFDYGFKILIPCLSMLFQHFGSHKFGHYIMQKNDVTFGHCKTIFFNLVKLSKAFSPIHIVGKELVNIGYCLGLFIYCCPFKFLHGKGVGEMSLVSLISELEKAVEPGTTCGRSDYVAEVIIPVAFSYLCKWWKAPFPSRYSDSGDDDEGEIGVKDINHAVTQVMLIIKNSLNVSCLTWMYNASACILPLIEECTQTLPFNTLLLIIWKISSELQNEELVLASAEKDKDSRVKTAEGTKAQKRSELVEKYQMLCRDVYTVLPLYWAYLKHHSKSHGENRTSDERHHVECYKYILNIFSNWYSSHIFRRELQTETVQLLKKLPYLVVPMGFPSGRILMNQITSTCPVDQPMIKPNQQNIIIKCLHIVLPLIGESCLDTVEQLLIVKCLTEYKNGTPEDKLKDDITKTLAGKPSSTGVLDQLANGPHDLFSETKGRVNLCLRLFDTSIKLHKIESPTARRSGKWRHFDLFRHRRKKAVIKCFLAIPFYSVGMSKSVNLFLQCYQQQWLKKNDSANLSIVQDLTLQNLPVVEMKQRDINPLMQLLNAFCVSSSIGVVFPASLYISYCGVLSESCAGIVDDEEKYDEDDPTKNYELFARDRSRIREKQNQLCSCGAASMIIDVLSCNTKQTPAVEATLKLGVSLLKGGNDEVQMHMFQKLKHMDAVFYTSISSLISSCSVLDWTTYERFNRAAPVGGNGDHASNCHVLNDGTFIHNLFRFLQLLCEGHNEDFQNNLRTQAGNTTTVNIVVHTVDYLLRLQESISDFYWHYSSYEAIDAQGREIFFKAFRIAKQVFRTLTEFIQGPCIANQVTLANSRLWDATSGFLMVLAKLQKQLLAQSVQLELFRELVKVEKDMFILLLSMLEGNTSVCIAHKMISTLIQSSEHVESMMKLYDMFMKLNDIVTSEAFQEYDLNKDGLISPSEFRKAMEAHHIYSLEEIDYLMHCADTNQDGMLDYMEFTERFHIPAKNIGFSLCVLITSLSQRVPYDRGLEQFKRAGKGILDYFEDNIGKIEIKGKSGRMEKVYFEIENSRRKQWKDKQIKESRKFFLQTSEVASSREKLESFINFCEDTIFEMEHIAKITDSETSMRMAQAEVHLSKHYPSSSSSMRLPVLGGWFNRINIRRRTTKIATVMWNRVLPIVIICLNFCIRKCLVCGSFLWCKCKTLWKMAKAYKKQRQELQRSDSSVPTTPIKTGSVIKRKGKPKLSLSVPPKQELLDGLSSGQLSLPSELNRHLARTEWLNDDSINVSFEYHKAHPRPQCAVAGPSTDCSVVNSTTSLDNTNGKQHFPRIVYHKSFQARIARNYYTLQSFTLLVALVINIFLLSSEHNQPSPHVNQSVIVHGDDERISIFISLLAVTHFLLSILLFVAYGYLKVPLIICKSEKRAAHALQFRKLWTHVKPRGIVENWDKLVIKSRHYPRKYFDKRIRLRVYEKLSPDERIKCGRMFDTVVEGKTKKKLSKRSQIFDLLCDIIDPYYAVWVVGVVLSSPDVFYHVGFCMLSLLGVYSNYFYFSAHLIYLVTSFKLLRTVLKSVLNNWKQLLMTFLMTCIVIYLYTVIAFNFFRKYYVHTIDDNTQIMKCQSMLQCFLYHIDKGLRSGGGIADVLVSAVGDDYENLRLLFDVTFFFVVIVILLAIIQGLIIDSFGELREKEKSTKEDMKRKCYVCGISKERFDQFPDGFENHTKNEHGMADYMYFLMYLISKPETEFSGQESYVWDHYIRRDWSFFPVGDCVQEQERRERERSKQSQSL
ncbi:ryanodine receptor 2-like isoform X2 [Dysidea avara]|uniref:ryanodine receptor 2-like isoform X2 n=1 Tax=Dysidea avara TaxID=196820 RepID=UPI003333F637